MPINSTFNGFGAIASFTTCSALGQCLVGDATGDKHLDVVSIRKDGVQHSAFHNVTIAATYFQAGGTVNTVNATVDVPDTTAWSALEVFDCRLGDVDGDRDDDVVCPVAGTGRIWVSLSNASHAPATGQGNGSGITFIMFDAFKEWTNVVNVDHATLYVDDVTGDGRADVLIYGTLNGTTGTRGPWVLESTGGGFETTQAESYRFTGDETNWCTDPARCFVRDFSGDGLADVVEVDANHNILEAWAKFR